MLSDLEFLPFDVGSLTNREAIELRKLGFNTPRLFWAALRAREVKEGDEVVDVVVDYVAWTAFVWLALRRVGIEADPATLEFDAQQVEYLPDEPTEPVEVDAGKASDPGPSTSSETMS